VRLNVKTWGGFGAVALLGIVDRALKMLVEQPRFDNSPIGWRYFGFEQFHNPGIAFGLPIPLWIVLPATAVLLCGLFVWIRHSSSSHRTTHLIAGAAILVGALSNALDRLTYGYTIDYIRLINGIINIADILVIAGLATFIFSKKHHS